MGVLDKEVYDKWLRIKNPEPQDFGAVLHPRVCLLCWF